MYRRKKGRQNNLLLFIICFALFLGVIGVNMFYKRNLNFSERILKDSEVFLTKIIYAPVKYVKDQTKIFTSKKSLIKENERLKRNSNKIEYNEAKIDNLENEVEKLKKQLELNTTLGEKVVLNATVVGRKLDGYYQTINIDKGIKNGVLEQMAVINSEGLIGIVNKTGNYSSTVNLLTSDTFDKISVRIKVDNYYVYGLLSGYNQKKNVFILEGIADNSNIPEGSVVTTTGMGKTFPSGLLVGKVKKVTTDNFDLAKIVEVTPAANFKDLDYVTVVKRDEKYDS